MNICEIPKGDRPYEKCLKYGTESLSDTELLAVMLGSGTVGKSSVELAGSILDRDGGGLINLHDLSIEELMEFPGVGEVKAVKLKCLAALCTRMAASTRNKRPTFSGSKDIADHYMELLRHEKQEKLLLVMLDGKLHLLGDEIVTVGSVNASIASQREIFIAALGKKAVYIVLLHNHPSGDPSPSAADLSVTEDVAYIGKLLNIRLLDHIIIGDRRFYSFRDEKLLE